LQQAENCRVQGELRAIAEGLAARLHRAVAIDDPHIRLLVHTAHDENVDSYRVQSVLTMQAPADLVDYVRSFGIATAEQPVRIPRHDEWGLLSRVCVPIRCDKQLFGYLWLIDDENTITDAELKMAADAAAAAGQLLHRDRLLGDLRGNRDRELLRDVLSDDSTAREHAAAQLVAHDRVSATASVVVVGVRLAESTLERVPSAPTELDVALERAARNLAPHSALTVSRSDGHGALLVADTKLPSPEQLIEHAKQLQAALAKALDGGDVVVAVGPSVRGLDAAHRSHAGAEDALKVAAAVPGFGDVVAYDDLGIYALLVHLPLDELPADAVPAGLRALIDKDTSGQLIETLETYLDAAGDARTAVERLSVHRTSLYYRLSRIEKIAGMSLADGGDRLALHLGIKLARLVGLLSARR
jgi:hypothetical protein